MSKAKSADLLMKLYDLRREATMRDARNWFITFFPESAQDVMGAMVHPDTSAYFRMVFSYWDMAASFVNHGAIDEEMFNEASGEGVVVFAKVEPFLEEIRTITNNQNFGGRLEAWVSRMPDYKAICEQRRNMLKNMMAARAEMMKTAGA
ncbi:MAG TPA: hypothetical protein VGO50_17825 [Pyrinomonadaceae bacterium]|jgi:hypothetical protein|nr:hypothetical protein [Pyrinomonadaceae bacterium]